MIGTCSAAGAWLGSTTASEHPEHVSAARLGAALGNNSCLAHISETAPALEKPRTIDTARRAPARPPCPPLPPKSHVTASEHSTVHFLSEPPGKRRRRQ